MTNHSRLYKTLLEENAVEKFLRNREDYPNYSGRLDLGTAFPWGNTPEGYDFWRKIFNKSQTAVGSALMNSYDVYIMEIEYAEYFV